MNAPFIRVPDSLIAWHTRFFGDDGRPWIKALPDLAAERVEAWQLIRDGEPTNGCVALVLPVLRADGTKAVLKLQPVDEQTVDEPVALRAWNGDGAVRLLEHDPASGTMLLERLDMSRALSTLPDDIAAVQVISELLVRLTAPAAPAGLRRLNDIGEAMLEQVPHALTLVPDPAERRLIADCAAAVRELLPETSDRLLHLDVHYLNVLRPLDGERREPWVAIDPKPISGDPGFELLPALWNRWDDVVATGDVSRAVRRRFDLMTEVLRLDRRRACGWTLGRVLQTALWDIERFGERAVHSTHAAIARILLDRNFRRSA